MSRIEQLIDEIEEYVEGCKPAPFSQSKIIVQKEQLYELLTELRLKTPDEIKRYQKIIAQKDKIISDAQAQAEQMIEETTNYANALVEGRADNQCSQCTGRRDCCSGQSECRRDAYERTFLYTKPYW